MHYAIYLSLEKGIVGLMSYEMIIPALIMLPPPYILFFPSSLVNHPPILKAHPEDLMLEGLI